MKKVLNKTEAPKKSNQKRITEYFNASTTSKPPTSITTEEKSDS